MNPFHRPQVTDELLSAYIDGDVTAEEKKLIERAVQTDANVAWRLESLQHTVNLLRSLPEVALPRSFVLTEADVAQAKAPVPPLVSAARRTVRTRAVEPTPGGFWQSLMDFLQGGSPVLRNMTAAGLAIWLMLFGVTVLNPSRLVPSTSVQVETMASPQSDTVQSAAQQNVAPQATIATAREVAIANAESSATTESNSAVEQGVEAQPAAVVAAEPRSESANSADQPALESPALTAQAEPQDQQAIASSDAQGEASVASEPAPAELALRSAPLEQSAGSEPDPLAQAMGDQGNGGGMGGGDISAAAAAAPPAPSDSAQVSEAAKTATGDETVADTPPVAAADLAFSEETSETLAIEAAQEAPATEEPVAQGQIAESQVAAEAAVPTEAETTVVAESVAATPTVEEVALAQPAAPASAQVDNQKAQPRVENVQMPLLDPMRVQIAQLTVALITAMLALFWLVSQRNKKRS